jgi:undecaprenyl-diphosphatase
MNLLQAAILGLVEGITEYLPVSSTGHLILVSHWLFGADQSADQQRAIDAFDIVIQGGAILAVVGLYYPRIVQMIRGLAGRNPQGLKLFILLIVAFLPAAILGLALRHQIEAKLFHPIPVLAALALGGFAMIAITPWQRRQLKGEQSLRSLDIDQLTIKHALIIGMMQCFALWPGMSRSMVTIVAGMLIGLPPRKAAEFSFLLGLPTLAAACAYKALKNHHDLMTLGGTSIAVGVIVATISAAIAVAFLVRFLNHHGLAVFGWYRLALCAVVGVLIWQGTMRIEPPAKETPLSASLPATAPSDRNN